MHSQQRLSHRHQVRADSMAGGGSAEYRAFVSCGQSLGDGGEMSPDVRPGA
jgi:hypothetical protein